MRIREACGTKIRAGHPCRCPICFPTVDAGCMVARQSIGKITVARPPSEPHFIAYPLSG